MKQYIIKNEPDVIFEETGEIKVCNYPPSPNTYSYIVKMYLRNENGSMKLVEGPAMYLNELPEVHAALATIIGKAQNALLDLLPTEPPFQRIK